VPCGQRARPRTSTAIWLGWSSDDAAQFKLGSYSTAFVGALERHFARLIPLTDDHRVAYEEVRDRDLELTTSDARPIRSSAEVDSAIWRGRSGNDFAGCSRRRLVDELDG